MLTLERDITGILHDSIEYASDALDFGETPSLTEPPFAQLSELPFDSEIQE